MWLLVTGSGRTGNGILGVHEAFNMRREFFPGTLWSMVALWRLLIFA